MDDKVAPFGHMVLTTRQPSKVSWWLNKSRAEFQLQLQQEASRMRNHTTKTKIQPVSDVE